MAISRNYRKKVVPVVWQGEEIATISPLGTDTIATIVSNVSEGLMDAMSAIEEGEMSIKGVTAESAADFLIEQGPGLIRRIAMSVPEVISEIIVQAAGDGDSDEAREAVASWSLPMQAEAVGQILRATFVDESTFRSFVGNVMALLQSANALTKETPQQRTQTSPASPSLADG